MLVLLCEVDSPGSGCALGCAAGDDDLFHSADAPAWDETKEFLTDLKQQYAFSEARTNNGN